VRAGSKSFIGPETQGYPLPTLPNQVCVECLLKAASSGSAFALAG
jgi:type VI secretion system secreted protein VgrG